MKVAILGLHLKGRIFKLAIDPYCVDPYIFIRNPEVNGMIYYSVTSLKACVLT